MYFKFVRHEPLYKVRASEVNCPINFIIGAERGRYETTIVWQLEDLPPFSVLGDNYFAVGLPPQEKDDYPIEVPLVWIYKPNDKNTKRLYYGFGCDLYVMSDEGTTLDKIRHNPFGINRKVGIEPVHPPMDWEAMAKHNETFQAGFAAGKSSAR